MLTNLEDHPRIRGEHHPPPPHEQRAGGSPPHTRGARTFREDEKGIYGITPAYAGSTVSLFADILKDTPTYKGGAIRLISCGTASEGAIAAQKLSDILGVEIMAPTDTVWIDFDGSLSIGEKQFTNTGKWVIIKPKGN